MNAMMVDLSLAKRNCPFGLLMFEQIFANLAFAAMPAETVIFVYEEVRIHTALLGTTKYLLMNLPP